MSLQDIETILDTLVYDDKVEKCGVDSSSSNNDGSLNLYRVIKPLYNTSGLMKVPCGVCPVRIKLIFLWNFSVWFVIVSSVVFIGGINYNVESLNLNGLNS